MYRENSTFQVHSDLHVRENHRYKFPVYLCKHFTRDLKRAYSDVIDIRTNPENVLWDLNVPETFTRKTKSWLKRTEEWVPPTPLHCFSTAFPPRVDANETSCLLNLEMVGKPLDSSFPHGQSFWL